MTEGMNEQRMKVFLDRYALRNSDGETVEDEPWQMWDRVAKAIATDEDEADAFRTLLYGFKFVPGGRILSGAGTETEVTFYNCYVIPLETRFRRDARLGSEAGLFAPFVDFDPNDDPGSDSREAIMDTIGTMVDIMSRGGGVGINWSVLRPKGTHLKRINGTTSGPVSWMAVASHHVQTVMQGGSRRGAAMFMLDDWHPDVIEFINAKRDLNKINGANVSVAVSDAFMAAVKADKEWTFIFPDTTHPAYNAEWDGDILTWRWKGYPVNEYLTLPAREIWHDIASAAWHNGEPGVVFLERYNRQSTAGKIERLISVNPCGEQGLGPYSVCNLGSMNLDAYIEIDKYDRKDNRFKWAEFQRDAETAVTFLDNVVDKNYYFLPENEVVQKKLRRIGLGVMGLADALIALDLRYGSPEAIDFTERVFSTLKTAAVRRSVVLAQTKGVAPGWSKDMADSPYLSVYQNTPLGTQIRKHGLRNLFLLTQAPTGSTSILAGVNSGIEPYFAFEYIRKDRTGTHKVLASAKVKYGGAAAATWVTSKDVTVEEHIAMQAAVQKYVDSSVSKTINAPNNHTVEDVKNAYTLAYESGLKGLAYFRDGNGREQVLYREDSDADSRGLGDGASALVSELHDEIERLTALVPDLVEYERPSVLVGRTTKKATRAGTAYVTVNRDEVSNRPVEVFFNVGKAGSEVAALAEALGRLASLALRKGATLGGVANQLEGVGGNSNFAQSIPHAIALALTQENARGAVASEGLEDSGSGVALTVSGPDGAFEFRGTLADSQTASGGSFDICPECHNASLSYQEGCSKCAICGFSAC